MMLLSIIYKVPAQYYLTKPTLGGYTLLFKFTWSYLQSPCSLLHNDPALGGYTGWSFYEHKAISSPRLLQAWQPGTWGLHVWNIQFIWLRWINPISSRLQYLLEQFLNHHFVLLKTWGIQVIWIWGREIFKILSFDPASATIMTWHHLFINPASFFPSLNRWITRWILSPICLLSRCLGSRLKWIILHNIFLWETNISKLSMKLAFDPDFLDEGNDNWT